MHAIAAPKKGFYMNALRYFLLLCTILVSANLFNFLTASDYETMMQQSAQEWTSKYLVPTAQDQQKTIINLLMLGYQIVKESCKMIHAKYRLQHDLLKIYTPSCVDSWYDNWQIQYNDLEKLETTLAQIKTCQQTLQTMYLKLKDMLPALIQTNPEPTQALIINLKNALYLWGKQQQVLTNELLEIKQAFQDATNTIGAIKNFFDIMTESLHIKHAHLTDTAYCCAKTNKQLDHVYDQFVMLRINSIMKIEHFFDIFFETYHKAIAQALNLGNNYPLLRYFL